MESGYDLNIPLNCIDICFCFQSANNFGATRGTKGRRGSGVGGHPPAVYQVAERIMKMADRHSKDGTLTLYEMDTFLRGTVSPVMLTLVSHSNSP